MSASDPRTTGRAVLPSLPPHGQIRRLALTGAAGTVGRCRDHTRQALHDWGWLPTDDPDQQARADDVLLVVSELVTNASRHAQGPDQLILSATERMLRVDVLDGLAAPPQPQLPHSPGRLGGHGLHTVALLTSRWGSTPRGDAPGKSVWAEFDVPTA
ncbi:ATP-binding protein [Kitasatospora sp. NBC_01287]|uniref:ATP-binding protein n=1 Tax=Kitasatospora sp. NBC_01287 TaxID=2903573 RepID=UPI002255519E|nr:ATP-binding protein [Kitasatospora sp. NBC_01287]MCX4744634.1 ATP-binding protein [Kitasatospora sp. NBC_01287]